MENPCEPAQEMHYLLPYSALETSRGYILAAIAVEGARVKRKPWLRRILDIQDAHSICPNQEIYSDIRLISE